VRGMRMTQKGGNVDDPEKGVRSHDVFSQRCLRIAMTKPVHEDLKVDGTIRP